MYLSYALSLSGWPCHQNDDDDEKEHCTCCCSLATADSSYSSYLLSQELCILRGVSGESWLSLSLSPATVILLNKRHYHLLLFLVFRIFIKSSHSLPSIATTSHHNPGYNINNLSKLTATIWKALLHWLIIVIWSLYALMYACEQGETITVAVNYFLVASFLVTTAPPVLTSIVGKALSLNLMACVKSCKAGADVVSVNTLFFILAIITDSLFNNGSSSTHIPLLISASSFLLAL